MKIRHLGSLLNLSCERASQLISESLDRPLTRSERFALRVHTIVCRGCRLLERQLRVLHAMVGRVPQSAQEQLRAALPRLSPDRKRLMKQVLSDASRAPSDRRD